MTFIATPAKREMVPLWTALVGPSSSGKTYSALRLATGMQSVVGGDIYGIDTESKRMLHYADQFKFMHVPFERPFGSLRYLEACRWAVAQGAKVVIIDSCSHEHEGEGGYLDTQEQELTRLTGGDDRKRHAYNFLAWKKATTERRKFINGLLQLNACFIFCFRAKEKLKIERGKDPVELGWKAIAGEEWVFEMTARCLLYPSSNGVPTWRSDLPGERETMKRPAQFIDLLKDGKQLDETLGAAMAKWALGGAATPAETPPPRGPMEGQRDSTSPDAGSSPAAEAKSKQPDMNGPLLTLTNSKQQNYEFGPDKWLATLTKWFADLPFDTAAAIYKANYDHINTARDAGFGEHADKARAAWLKRQEAAEVDA